MKVIEVNGGGLDNLKVVERTNPAPAAGEVLVHWHATSLNFHDYLVAIGAIPVAPNRIPMSDGAGEVIEVGKGVTKWKVGDKVMSMFFPNWVEGKPTLAKTRAISGESIDGYIAEQSCVSTEAVTAIPNNYTYGEAATLPCAALTAWRGLISVGNLNAGETVLIEGTGGMSMFGLQIALAAGATVYATTSSEAKAERLKAMGVAGVVNYKEDSRWGKTILKMSGGGVDHVLDVGGGSTMKQSIEAAKIGGSIISIGILGNGRKGEITFPKLFFKHLQMTGIAVDCRIAQEAMVNAINVAQFKPLIDKSFAFDELAAAFRYQETGQHFGKIILEW